MSTETPPPLLPSSHNLAFVEQLYADYLRDPDSVETRWRQYFASWGPENERAFRTGPTFEAASLFRPQLGPNGRAGRLSRDEVAELQDRVDQLVRAFRVRGHLEAHLNPLGLPRPEQPELEPSFYGLTQRDLERKVSTTSLGGDDHGTLASVLARMRATYCRSIGVQFMHIDDLEVKRWLQGRMESTENRLRLTRDEQVRILTKLTDAVIFEQFVQKKYLGAKSFSLEGAESLIPLLDLAIERAGEHGIDEIVLAMAHRGRLNVLANLLGKNPRQIFREFEDTDPELHMGRGDVKYHLGHSTDIVTPSGRKMHLSLCFNPSHLEFVNPVALGRLRAKQDRVGDEDGSRGVAFLIHGDAAFAGEGVTQETLNLSQLAAYRTGGAIHVVVNNQIGFTTPPEQGRSTIYCTDVAKMLQSPIFHVNGEDPEAVVQVVRLAMDFREKYRRDVVIDMYCYRRRGHNEGDEPAFTQPRLYQAIARRKDVREGYLDHLAQLGEVTKEEAEDITRHRREHLENELGAARQEDYKPPADSMAGVWQGYLGGSEANVPRIESGIEPERAARLLGRLVQVPDGFRPHPKLERWLGARADMAAGKRPVDWAAAEALALTSLAAEGHRVRMTGQDAERGTFSHRHAVLHDVSDGHEYRPFANVDADQAPVEIHNSPLSEIGVLGFEYGYSLDSPHGLTIWEAQFGDFVNVAQVIIDQFIFSAEDKWRRLSNLVLLLPHGFEGMGPEHSSARFERFLMLAAEENVQITNLTTPANYFHALRRQVLRPWRKPLVVMTPKSLLRHPAVVSTLEDLGADRFQRVIPDTRFADTAAAKPVRRVLLCSGKIYYDLEEQRRELEREDVAIVRLEQLYPVSLDDLRDALAPYADGTQAVWVQEEPENMGAWRFLAMRFGDTLLGRLPFTGIQRRASASPATGSANSHRIEQQAILDKAFDLS